MTVHRMHAEAMALTDAGDILKRAGNIELAQKVFLEASKIEEKCALLSTEPSKGILYLSAAWLAHNGGDYMTSSNLVISGLETAEYPQREGLMELKEKLKEHHV